MDSQGFDHCARSNIWYTALVALLHCLDDQHDTDLGIEQETVTYLGRIQHHVDMAFMHGAGTASN